MSSSTHAFRGPLPSNPHRLTPAGRRTLSPSAAPRPDGLGALVALSLPALFILLWSTGYVAGKLALPHAGPFT